MFFDLPLCSGQSCFTKCRYIYFVRMDMIIRIAPPRMLIFPEQISLPSKESFESSCQDGHYLKNSASRLRKPIHPENHFFLYRGILI